MADQKDNPTQKPRRFYALAEVVAHEGGFGVALDGRLAKTPDGDRMVVPKRAMAELLAAEWQAQSDVIDMAAMPVNRLAFTALDRAAQSHAALAEEVARYASADMLLYFAEAPTTLVELEVAHWGPVIAWAEGALGVSFVRATGIVHQDQPAETLERIRALAAELDAFALTGLTFAAGLFGSAILAFAVERGMLTGDAAFNLSRLDEAYQEERWGFDEEAAERTANHRRDADMVQQWFAALRQG
jgi:chaperone required for assembly of F1-ATPase